MGDTLVDLRMSPTSDLLVDGAGLEGEVPTAVGGPKAYSGYCPHCSHHAFRPPARPQVHTGFAERAATIPLLPFVHALRPTSADTPAKRLLFCGHSMGGGVAALVALRLVTQATAFRYNPFETSVVASAAQPASAQRRVGLYERDASLAVRVALPPPLLARAVSDAGRWERRMGAGGRRRC